MAQNLCLALRAQGVATTFTTLLVAREPEVKELLGIPGHMATACHIVAGYPARPFPRRLHRPDVSELAFADRYGSQCRRGRAVNQAWSSVSHRPNVSPAASRSAVSSASLIS